MTRIMTQQEQVTHYTIIGNSAERDSFHAQAVSAEYAADGDRINADLYRRDAVSLAHIAASAFDRAAQARNGRNYGIYTLGGI